MKIYRDGDLGRVLCHACKSIKESKYTLRDVPLSDGSDVVKNVLVSVCNTCNSVCSIPQQSLPLVQQVVKKSIRDSVEVRLTQPVDDIFNMACVVLDANREFRSTLVRYFAKRMLQKQKFNAKEVDVLLLKNKDFLSGAKVRRMSLKGVGLRNEFDQIKNVFHIEKDSDFISAVAIQINKDIVENKSPEVFEPLKTMAAIMH